MTPRWPYQPSTICGLDRPMPANASIVIACIAGVAASSASETITTPATNSTAIAEKIAQPWRRLPTIRPNVLVRAAGIRMITALRRSAGKRKSMLIFE